MLLAAVTVATGEVRTWTDVKGRTLKGKYVKQDDSAVWLMRDNGRQVRIVKSTLSESDRKHLEELSNLPGQGKRFDTRDLDPSVWKPRDGGFKFDGIHYLNTLEGDHFIVVAGTKVRDSVIRSYLEAAERLWLDVATDLPLLTETFKGRRMLIVLADGDDQAQLFANWHGKHADRANVSSSSYRLIEHTIVSFTLGSDLAAEAGLMRSGRFFRIDAKNAQNTRLEWTGRIHFMASELLRNVIWSVKTNDGHTFSLLQLSFAYHREESICGRIETKVTFGFGEDVEGFSNGRNWAGYTRKILKQGHGPNIESYLKKKGSEAVARDLGFGHGLMYFIHKDPARLGGFNKVLVDAVADNKVPDANSFAKALGYASTTALNEAWLAFMLSDEFE